MTNQAPAIARVYWTLVLAVTLMIVFTPFESPDSFISVILPRVVILVCIAMVAPFIILQPYRFLRPALIMMVAMLFHLTFFMPAPGLQLLAEWVGLISIVFFARVLVDKNWAAAAAIKIVLLVNVAAVLVQFASVQLDAELIQFHRILFPMSEGRVGGETFTGVIRVGGFHLEPGTYCTWVAMLVVMSRLLTGRFWIVEWVATLSMLLTYSTAGIIYVLLLGFWYTIDVLKLGRVGGIGIVVSLVFIGGLAFSALGLDEYLLERFGLNISQFTQEEGADGQEWRQDALAIYSALPISEKLIGIGHADEICEECPFDDFGFLPNMVLRGGVLGALGVIATALMMIKLMGLTTALLVLAIVGSAKAPTNALAPWIVLFLASELSVPKSRKSRRRRRR